MKKLLYVLLLAMPLFAVDADTSADSTLTDSRKPCPAASVLLGIAAVCAVIFATASIVSYNND